MRREKGLTTNELLVSVATLAAVMGMAFAAFRGLGGAAESSSARVRAASEARWVFLRLDSVLPAVASHTLARAGRYSFWGEEGGAVWDVSAPRELGPPSRSFEKVSLQFRRDEGLVVLTRGTQEEVLAKGVEEFRLRYAGEKDAFRPSWGEKGESSDRLPAFVLVRIELGGKERLHVVALGREE